MALPPLEAGAFQVSLALALPAVATTWVGAPGTLAVDAGLTVKDCVTWGAAEKVALPAWLASRVHVPAPVKLTTPPALIEHTEVPVVATELALARPEVAVAVGV